VFYKGPLNTVFPVTSGQTYAFRYPTSSPIVFYKGPLNTALPATIGQTYVFRYHTSSPIVLLQGAAEHRLSGDQWVDLHIQVPHLLSDGVITSGH
jgi:hypothetical protein